MEITNVKSYKKLCLAAATLVAAFSIQSASAASICGPGAHWVDSCIGGTDNFVITGAFGLDFTGLGFFNITIDGLGTVSRSDPVDTADALDPGHLNQINTEITSATALTNNLPGAGVLTARFGTGAGVATPTFGVITETSDAGIATSYFDFFLEVDSALGTFHNPGALRFTADISEWLPGQSILYRYDAANSDPTIVNSIGQQVAFFDDLGGAAFMTLTAVPVPPAVILFGSGLIGLLGIGRRKKIV